MLAARSSRSNPNHERVHDGSLLGANFPGVSSHGVQSWLSAASGSALATALLTHSLRFATAVTKSHNAARSRCTAGQWISYFLFYRRLTDLGLG
jgi:hypothetical protein